MPDPMLTLLTRLPEDVTTLTPAAFAALFGDGDFNGMATEKEMTKFWEKACQCIAASGKSDARKIAIQFLQPLLKLDKSIIFPKLNTNIVTYQLILRILKPERVNQKEFGLCGPAHFMIVLIKSRPAKYASMAIELLKIGKTTGEDGSELIPDEYVTDYDPGDTIPQADWLLAASLRNAQTPIPLGKEGTYSGTKGPDVFAYCLHAGYKRIAYAMCYQRATDSIARFFASDGYSGFKPEIVKSQIEARSGLSDWFNPEINFKMACVLRQDGWRVLLLSNSELFKNSPPSEDLRQDSVSQDPTTRQVASMLLEKQESKWNPIVTEKKIIPGLYVQNFNHWVLAKNIDERGGSVFLDVYTWGGQYSLKGEVKMKDFVNCYGGFVAAKD
jgi:hypothetical protein